MPDVPRNVTVNVHAALDAEGLAVALDQMREALGAMVAALTADGFTDDQARAIVTAAVIASATR